MVKPDLQLRLTASGIELDAPGRRELLVTREHLLIEFRRRRPDLDFDEASRLVDRFLVGGAS